MHALKKIFVGLSLSTVACTPNTNDYHRQIAELETQNRNLTKQLELSQQELQLCYKIDSLRKITTTEKSNDHPSPIQFLTQYAGSYPYQVDLLHNQILMQRLRGMLGKRLNYLQQVWVVQSPIEVRDGYFLAQASKQGSGKDSAALIMADIANNRFYVALKGPIDNNGYSEDSTRLPIEMTNWLHKH